MKNIKLVAIDVDGTLLNENHELSDANKQEVDRLLDHGIHVVPCTGRPIHEVPEFLLNHEKLKYIIGGNGAVIYDRQLDQVLHQDFLDLETAQKIVKIGDVHECSMTLSSAGHLYSNKQALEIVKQSDNQEFANYFEHSREIVDDLNATLVKQKNNIEKLNFNFQDDQVRQSALKELQKISGIHITASFGHNLEINTATAQKGIAVDKLRKQLNIQLDQVVTIGDNLNDISMLALTKHSFAMKNGDPKTHEVASYVTDTNNNDGVAKVLKKIVT